MLRCGIGADPNSGSRLRCSAVTFLTRAATLAGWANHEDTRVDRPVDSWCGHIRSPAGCLGPRRQSPAREGRLPAIADRCRKRLHSHFRTLLVDRSLHGPLPLVVKVLRPMRPGASSRPVLLPRSAPRARAPASAVSGRGLRLGIGRGFGRYGMRGAALQPPAHRVADYVGCVSLHPMTTARYGDQRVILIDPVPRVA